jgi:hypothetical protein
MKDERFTLRRDEKHFGFWCAAGTEVDRFERSGTLARNQLFRGVLLPRGSRFWHDVDFDYVVVQSNGPLMVRRHWFGDETRIEFSPRIGLEAWRSWVTWALFPLTVLVFIVTAIFNRLRRWMAVIPSEDMTIHGVKVVAGDRVHLRKDGSLESLLLSAPRTVSGRTFETGHLHFSEAGRLERALLYRPQEIDGVPCVGMGLAKTDVEFWPDGTLRTCVLDDEYTHGGQTFGRGTRLRFERDGSVRPQGQVNVDVAVYSFRPEVHNMAASAASRDKPNDE